MKERYQNILTEIKAGNSFYANKWLVSQVSCRAMLRISIQSLKEPTISYARPL